MSDVNTSEPIDSKSPNYCRPVGNPEIGLPTHPANLPWPPKVPEDYQAGVEKHVKEGKTSEKAFLYDLAMGTFGADYMERLAKDQESFQGNWFQLAYLLRCHETLIEQRVIDNGLHLSCRCPFCLEDWDNSIHLENVNLTHAQLTHAQLDYAHLENATLYKAHLENAFLRFAHLENANLYEAHLENAKLREARLENAKLNKAYLENAKLRFAHLENADLCEAHLENADLREACLENAKLNKAYLTGAELKDAVLNGADVRNATGIVFDNNRVERFLIEGNAPDPWSQLRCAYSGPSFFFHLLLLVAFFIPYLSKAVVLTGVSESMNLVENTEQILESQQETLNPESNALLSIFSKLKEWWGKIKLQSAFWTLVGFRNYKFGVFTFFLITLMMIVYNVLRLKLTRDVSTLRDAEERSKITPGRSEYMGETGQKFDSKSFWVVFPEAGKQWWSEFTKWLKQAFTSWRDGSIIAVHKLWNVEVWVWKQRNNKVFFIVTTIVVVTFLAFSFLDRLFLWLWGLLLLLAITGWIFGLVKGFMSEEKTAEYKGTLFPPSLIKYLGLYRVHQIASVLMYVGYVAIAIQITIWLWRTQFPTY